MLSANDILRDRYKIIRLLGQGGMGAVYEAHDNVFDTSVALKEIIVDLSSAQNTKAQELLHLAFEREAKLLAKISHETFPHVKDYFSDNNRQFLVMELVDGEDLATLLKDRGCAFPASDIINWTDQLLDGLDYLHTQNPPIIHRDLKPQNLKLTTRGKMKLLDFGIAKGTDAGSANTVTNQTFVAATLNYSPIEQMLRVIDPTFLAVITHKYAGQIDPILEQNADVTSDIYALGATLYNLLTNTPPIEAVKRAVEVWDGKPDPLRSPSDINPQVPKEVSDFIMKSMEINRDDRFASASEMRNGLKQISSSGSKQSDQKTAVMNFAPEQFTSPQNEATQQFNSESDSVRTIAAPTPRGFTDQPEQRSFTAANASTNTAQAENSGSNLKLLLLIPLFGVIFLFLGVSAFGVWWMYGRDSGGVTKKITNTKSNKPLENNSNINADVAPTPMISDLQGDDSNSNTNTSVTPTPVAEESPIVASKTTKSKKPAKTKRPPVVVKKRRDKPVKTKRKKPRPVKKKKNMKCIFTDDC